MQTMLDILFIGKSNSVNTELYSELSSKFVSQLSADSLSALQTTLSFVSPKMLLFSLSGYSDNGFTAILEHLSTLPERTPVLLICDEQQAKSALSFLSGNRFSHILRPTTNEAIIAACRQVISTNGNVKPDAALRTPEPAPLKSHVLIIDDNAMTLRVTKRMLEDVYSVAIAVSGSQAFMSIAKKKPDVILLDYEMPLVNGEAAMLMLRDNEDTRDIPVIFFTSAADSDTVMKLLALNPAGYILKPPDRQKLIELIEKSIKH